MLSIWWGWGRGEVRQIGSICNHLFFNYLYVSATKREYLRSNDRTKVRQKGSFMCLFYKIIQSRNHDFKCDEKKVIFSG